MGMGNKQETRTQIGMAIEAVTSFSPRKNIIKGEGTPRTFHLENHPAYKTSRAELLIGNRRIPAEVYIDRATYAVGIKMRASQIDREVVQLFEALRSPRDKQEKRTHRKHEKPTIWHIGIGQQTANGSRDSYSLLRTLDTSQDKRHRLKFITPVKKARLDSEPATQKLSDFCAALSKISKGHVKLVPRRENLSR